MTFRTGTRNLLTDVAGLTVGNAHYDRLKSGTTVILCDDPAVASVQVLGGAPGTRETDLLEPHNSVAAIDAIVLSGGSAHGLDAASGATAALREKGRGYAVRGFTVPIVPSAIIFDLANGGDKSWGRYAPYRELGYMAANLADPHFELGTVGAGAGALSAGLKGGLGSASTLLPSGFTLAALAIVNPTGSVTVGRSRHFWAAPFEIGAEFGGLGLPSPMPADAAEIRWKFDDIEAGANTTIAIIATDAVFTKAEAKRLAIAAHDGFARAIWPSHTPADGDLVFAVATGKSGRAPDFREAMDLYATAGATMARAIARGVYEATPNEGDIYPVWSSLK